MMDEWVWILPVLFALHDLEEIATISWWSRRLDSDAFGKNEWIQDKVLRKLARVEVGKFSLAVLEEMVILTLVCIISIMFSIYGLWWGLFLAYGLHLAVHFLQAVYLRGYIPGLVFVVIELPVYFWMLQRLSPFFSLSQTLLWGFVGIVIMVLNLQVLHRWMRRE